jgi:prolyl 4-hydroxylase
MNEDFQRAREAAGLGQYSRARRLFERAATAGVAQAFTDLALISLNGLVDPPDYKQAHAGFTQAASRGDAEAHYWLALLTAADSPDALQSELFRQHFIAALQGRFSGALRAFASLASRYAEHYGLASAALALCAAQKDPFVSYLLQYARGQNGLPESLAWLQLEAAPVTPSARQIESVLQQALPESQPTPLGPHLQLFDSVLSGFECLYLRLLSTPGMQPAMVIDPKTGERFRSDLRTNSSNVIGPDRADLAVRLMERRIADLLKQDLSKAEPLGVLRYAVGEEYKPHRDYLHDPKELYADRPGQRLRTAFVYLNDVDLGGETEFLHWNKRVEAKTGRLVSFANTRADGSVEPDSVHAGLPVHAGEKWLATLWFRERSLRTW